MKNPFAVLFKAMTSHKERLKPIVPEYVVIRPDKNKDRLIYQIKTPRPGNQNRRHVHWENPENEPLVIYYDENGKPSDIGYQMSIMSRQHIVSRRKTPRISDVVED